MPARVLVVDPNAPDPAAVQEAARVLAASGLVVLPTETVYGLAARATDAAAIARVFAAKGRPTHHPLIAHVTDEEGAHRIAASWPKIASRLTQAFWPGPLTLVVDRHPDFPSAVSGGSSSLAIRAPSHPVARAVIAALGEAVAAPSANRYQGLSPTTAQHVVKELGDAVDLVLDAGPCEAGIESTVVDIRRTPARVLRPGTVGLAELRRVVPDIEAAAEGAATDAPRASPGMDARHYAPRARLVLAHACDEAWTTAAALAATRKLVGLVTFENTATAPSGAAIDDRVLVRALPADPAHYARLIYRTLHDLDDAGVDAIVVQAVPDEEAWWAVADRLRRGAAG